jgi:purine-binding chemotaxis protein CheW
LIMQQHTHLVTLGLGAEIFAVPVACVIEILAMRDLFRVPDGPPFLAGLADVRDQAVPVIDLRRKLGMPAVEVTHQTRIIVLEVFARGRKLAVGLIADRVIEVITLPAERIGPPPDVGGSWRSDYIAGVGRHGAGFVIVFAMESLFSHDEVAHITRDFVAPPVADAA